MSSVCDFFSFFFNLGAEEWKLEKVLVEKKLPLRQLWHAVCSFSARMSLFLAVYVKKMPESTTAATVLLTLPPVVLHQIFYLGTVMG